MRWFRILLLGVVLFAASDLPAQAAAPQGVPEIEASAYLLMDARMGQVLVDVNGRERLPIASTTKIMTAILALERGDLSELVTAGQKPYDTGGTTIYLEIGEQQTLENLLYALMLESANDAAVAIAEHLAGSEEAFAAWMNAKARELGARDTHFVNSHGLHHPEHLSTAYDLALMARYALRNPTFRRIARVEEKEIPGYKENPPRKLINRNRLLGYYDGANGVKNGFTEQAGLTNVASAKRGETELISVILGAESLLWTSSMKLLDYGFENFQTVVVAAEGDLVGAASVQGAGPVPAFTEEALAVTSKKGSPPPERQAVWETGLSLPLAAGARVGELRAVLDGKVLGSVPLRVAATIADSPSIRSAGPAVLSGQGDDPSWSRPETAQVFLFVAGLMLMMALSFILRYRRRKGKGATHDGRPRGRERLYEIRRRKH